MDSEKFKKVRELVSKMEEINNNLEQLEYLNNNFFKIDLIGKKHYDHFLYFEENEELTILIIDEIKSLLIEKKYSLEKELEEL
jgi:hypothetical protein